MPSVVFTPSGLRGMVEVGQTLLDAARQLGVDLDSVCGGRGICGRCQIVPTFGEFAKHGLVSAPDNVRALTEVEAAYAGRRRLEPGSRLGCAAAVCGDLVVDVPASSQVHRPIVRKSLDFGDVGVTVDPVVRLYFVEVANESLGGDRSDYELLADALNDQWALPTLTTTIAALAGLQRALVGGTRRVTAAVHNGQTILAVYPGLLETVFGIAIDIGSTTVAGHLCDLATGEALASAGIMNPQIRFGEDLMSRVSYVMMNPSGKDDLVRAIRGALESLVTELIAEAGVERERVLDIVLVGNPIMHHLVLGIDPTPLGTAPFALATALPIDTKATEVGISISNAMVHLLPCIAGHVGADTAAAVLATQPHRSPAMTLIVDVGTNAELVLGNHDGLLAASSPTGPAFEGAQISCGQRATAGAIERVRIDRETLEPRFRVIGSSLWSDEPGFASTLPEAGVSGICGSGIIEVIAEMFLSGIIDADGRILGSDDTPRSPRIVADGRTFAYVLVDGPSPVRVTQNDVRAIQLAKAALHAGARLLMNRAGVDHLDAIKLAGAFGSHIDPVYALVLGLLPDCDPAAVTSVGNAAGTGAVLALLSAAARRDIAAVARSVTKVETAIEPGFQEHFVEAMAFPHASDPYARLQTVVSLPPRVAAAATGRVRSSRNARRVRQ